MKKGLGWEETSVHRLSSGGKPKRAQKTNRPVGRRGLRAWQPGCTGSQSTDRHPPGPANRARRPPSARVLIALAGSELALAPLRFVLRPRAKPKPLRVDPPLISSNRFIQFQRGGFDKLTEGKATRIEVIFAY
ncbi:uncharacterized protein K441DRAFT_653884 [Cenococcum geophilum 1.58]|uniref:uncharacterized protein n=1 Tax=Cenococcum geophilum 1.58 TaxID=794803 RepID=UPI00358E7BA0|nr:hypothetical protein K441DRAFT_653884 [Cenococcum geophilum 1.58]